MAVSALDLTLPDPSPFLSVAWKPGLYRRAGQQDKCSCEQRTLEDREVSADYLEQVREEIAYIEPYKNADYEWYNEGLDLLRSGQLEAAELKFKELIMSQPEHQDGYEGLALVYQRLGRKDEAVFFMQAAIERAEELLREGTLDREGIDWLKETLREIQEM